MGTGKKLCKWSEKTIKKNIDQVEEIVSNPKFYCKNCLRCANKEKWLCKSVEFKSN